VVKLAFWDTVNGAYRFVFTHPLTILRTGWLYLALDALSVALRGEAALAARSGAIAFAVGVLLFGASIAWNVALVRAILLDEHSWGAALQFRRRHWRLVGIGLLLLAILIAIMAAVALAGVVVFHVGGPAALAIFVVFAAIVGAALIGAACRLYLLGPAIATDDPAGAIAAAWRRGRGNTFRLFFGGVLMVLPPAIVGAIFGGALGVLLFVATHGDMTVAAWMAQLDFAGRAALGLGQGVIQLVVGAFSIAFYTSAYRQLAANWNPPPALAALQLDT